MEGLDFMPTKTVAIHNFLKEFNPDLGSLYDYNMEVQVLVAQDDGELVIGEYKGREFHKWTKDGISWKSFRIPYEAMTDHSHFEDHTLTFNLLDHAEGIGMTGWDWVNQKSIWVAFDFDSIKNHEEGLTQEQIDLVYKKAVALDYVTVRRSTSGTGYHIYIFLEPVDTKSHKEHAALARSILGKMCSDTGHDFMGDVDCFGSNMWVWHRKINDVNGLKLVKEGSKLSDIPVNWKDHINVVKRKARKVKLNVESDQDEFERLINQKITVSLDEQHVALIDHLTKKKAFVQWIQDHHMLVTHTHDLKLAHENLNLRGVFDTISEGREQADHNCFLYPIKEGAWVVRRFTKGIQEHSSWSQDSIGWTKCYLNRSPDIGTVSRIHGGVEDIDGSFVFKDADSATEAAKEIGIMLDIPNNRSWRTTTLKIQTKTNRLVASVKQESSDEPIPGWLCKKGVHQRIFGKPKMPQEEPEVTETDDYFRHCVTENGNDAGWYLKKDSDWNQEPLVHIKYALTSLGYGSKESNIMIGTYVQNCWKMVNRPFQPEYLGSREWNYKAAQFAYPIKEDTDNLNYPTWLKILEHCGSGLDDIIKDHDWCKKNNIGSGANYLKCWIASMFQYPLEPLPYLFFYGDQNCGKSIFHESLSLLMTHGFHRADTALVNTGQFNGELKNIVLAIVEETNLGSRRNGQALNKIKDWVTSPMLSIHEKQKTPILLKNSLHFVQCANDISFVPIFPGDTRVTMTLVPSLKKPIPKRELIDSLKKEASDFLTELINLEIPWSPDRLRVPMIATDEKLSVEEANTSDLETFLIENVFHCPGNLVPVSIFHTEFCKTLEPGQVQFWTKRRLVKEMSRHTKKYPKGRSRRDNQHYFANLSFDPETESSTFYIKKGEYLEDSSIRP